MDLTPEPPPPSAQKTYTNPFPFPLKPPDPFFPPKFSWDDTAFRPESFLESFKVDYGGRRLELRKRLVEHLRGPLTFQHQCRFQSWNQMVAKGVTPAHFRSAVSLVIAALDRGYYPNDTETLLSTAEWAELACAVTAAAGRGYARSNDNDKSEALHAARNECRDVVPEASNLVFDSVFHRLGATAEALQTYVEGDDQIASWLPGIEDQSKEILELLATNRVDEALATWEGLEVSRLANLMLPNLPQRACDANLTNIRALVNELGYELTPKTDPHVTGTTTGPDQLPAMAPRPPSPPSANDRTHPRPPNMDINALTAAVQAAMQPLMSRLEAVERASLNTPAAALQSARILAPADAPRAGPAPRTTTFQQNPKTAPAVPHNTTPANQEEMWTVATKRKRKRGGKKPDPTDQVLRQINLTPRSYAATAAADPPVQQANNPTSTAPPTGPTPPALTEITILRFGGALDENSERAVRARQPDAIVREVKANIARAVAKPLPIISGRWSSGTRSRGNFVFTMRGQIDFSTIQKFERFLTSPFPGGGQLCPNQGWTKLLAHGVPVMDNEDSVFGPDDLLRETRTMTGLRNAYFSSPPHWVKPVSQMSSYYSSLTFAFSDPDGAITKQLMGSRQALFGKQVQIERWVDKPLLLQCSRCHTLGHASSSKVCRLPTDSVRCYICGKGHLADAHNRECARSRQHKVAGVCDCKPQCISCNKVGHHARDTTCPAREGYRSRRSRPSSKNKGKEKAHPPPDLTTETSGAPNPQSNIGNSLSAVIPDEEMAGPSNGPFVNQSPRTDLAGPGLSPEEASTNAAAKITKRLAELGIPLPTPRELTTRYQSIHNAEIRRRMGMGPGSGTTWESVVEVDLFIEGERTAHLPSGYFYPEMPENRRAQLAAIVPKSVTHMPSNAFTPSPAGNQPQASQC